ncbi:hypothetical protein ACFU9W_09785 [Streptomyces sp. NPDC057600]|uniref:hypothetical protein n=1 Tax=Streptomyces sp. NPDC057600 TaxID=3346180 RepID=UPI0036A6D02D
MPNIIASPEVEVARRFKRDTADHVMTVLHEEGLYRHLRFAAPQPDSWMHWFEIVTWPGHLAITGDMDSFSVKASADTFMHSRISDMFEFFRGNGINPTYWSQKVDGGAGVKAFSRDEFRSEVLDYIKDSVADWPGLREAVADEVFGDESIGCSRSAHAALYQFEHEGFRFDDASELDFERFTPQYLWCCHAIVWGIAQYDAARKAVAA